MSKDEPGQNPLPHPPMGPRPTPTNPNPVDFGPNVFIFDPSMSISDIQSKTTQILNQQQANQFGTERIAFFFKPGSYDNLVVDIGYYTTIHGLGSSPDDVNIIGGVQSAGDPTQGGSALNNFWRGVENLAVTPTVNNRPLTPTNENINMWAVSQATHMRRVHIKGNLFLYDYHFDGQGNYSSGGFIADSAIDNKIISGTQQQFLTRNTTLTNWYNGVWNMVFVGDNQPPSGTFPNPPFTVVDQTPVVREKPYLVVDSSGNYAVQVPALRQASQGPSWVGSPVASTSLPINQFYIANAATDTANTLNAALQQGYHLILTPGVYHLASSLDVNYPDTVILGLGMATLTPDNGQPAMTIADVDGVSISGILFDAGLQPLPSILVVGPNASGVDHSAKPIALYDLSCRVGGAALASVQNCFTINANNVILDNVWLWRADHGPPNTQFVDWGKNPAQNGLTVNGHDVTAYGLFVEHFEGYQTLWNGERGSTYFYQSEIPYDVPNQTAWQQNGENGYPSYKVSNQVTTHTARGLGVYCFFQKPNVQLDNAIETPTGSGISMQHMVTVWLGKAAGTAINHILNGQGNAVVDGGGGKVTTSFL
jgi:hypothetical protein